MDDEEFYDFEEKIFEELEGKMSDIYGDASLYSAIEKIAKTFNPSIDQDTIAKIAKDTSNFYPINDYLKDERVEDIMVNSIDNIFINKGAEGEMKVSERIKDPKELIRFVKKLNMYATANDANKHIYDIHLPNGSRANVVKSPRGASVTIRNFKKHAFSVIDLINFGELNYNIAARIWLYSEGLKVRPANLLLGGTPGSGKTTLLNAMFSFFRPEERVVVIEDTYELNTETQENCVRLETNLDLTLEDLLKNVLRMRPDMIIIGEIRGAEAKDLISAMTIGKIVFGTIHASTTRDIVNRLEQPPMSISSNAITLIDALMVISQISSDKGFERRITQISEVSGIETKVLLSDLYLYDYRTRKGSPILPSITYRDALARLSGFTPNEIIAEENRRAKILETLNKMGIRDMRGINEFCKEYYDNPRKALQKIGLEGMGVLE